MVEACQGKDEVMTVREEEISAKQKALSEAEMKVVSLVDNCTSLKEKLVEKMAQIHSQNTDIQKLKLLGALSKKLCLLTYKLHYELARLYNHVCTHSSYLSVGLGKICMQGVVA